MRKKFMVFDLFGDIERDKIAPDKEQKPCTVHKLTKQFDDLIQGDSSRRDGFQPILRINSHGGSTEQAISLYVYLRQLPASLTTFGLGFVGSAAVYIFLAGERRLCTPETDFHIHGGVYTIEVPHAELDTEYRAVKARQELIKKIVIERTTVKPRILARWMDHGAHLDAQDALQYGLVHEIVSTPIFQGEDVYIANKWY